MQNAEIADVFDEVADLLEFQDANPFRVRAYRNAARTLRDLPEAIASIAANPEFWECATRTVGVDHLLFGTDYPFGGPDSVRRGIQRITSLEIGDDEKQGVLAGTADRLLR